MNEAEVMNFKDARLSRWSCLSFVFTLSGMQFKVSRQQAFTIDENSPLHMPIY